MFDLQFDFFIKTNQTKPEFQLKIKFTEVTESENQNSDDNDEEVILVGS